MTTKADVIRVHLAHPAWCAEQIAAYLGCGEEYVRATAYRNGLRLKRKSHHGRPILPRKPKPETLTVLGVAARAAGLTVADIQKIAESRRVHAVAMRAEAE